MNIIKTLLLTIILLIPLLPISSTTYWATICGSSIFSINCNANIPYCDPYWTEPCWLNQWIWTLQWQITNIENNRTFSQYSQDIIQYLLWFITLIAFIYIIYAWFNILTWVWDEEKAKKTKSIIIYVIIWMILIWLAYPIAIFIINVLNAWSTTAPVI